MSTLTATLSIQYTAPGPTTVSIAPSFSCSYTAQEGGTIDVPDTTASATAYQLSLGSIATLTGLYIKNNTGQELGLRFGAASSDEFQLGVGFGMFIACPTAPTANKLTVVKVVTTATQTGAGTVDYIAIGDPVS